MDVDFPASASVLVWFMSTEALPGYRKQSRFAEEATVSMVCRTDFSLDPDDKTHCIDRVRRAKWLGDC